MLTKSLVARSATVNDRLEKDPSVAEPTYISDPEFIAKRREIFCLFLARDDVPAAHACEEFARIESVQGDAQAYLRLQRTGSRFAMTRDRRLDFVLVYENAGNHAGFAFEQSQRHAA